MALVKTDWSVAANGDIRHVTGTTNHTVLELHRFLMDLTDDSVPTGDDLLDVTATVIASKRNTDTNIVLYAPYNIGDTEAARFYGGKITQDGGDEIYAGLTIQGSVNLTTQFIIIQNGAVLSAATSKNPDTAKSILDRRLVKVRTLGADIDGKRIRVKAAELGDTYFYADVLCEDDNNTAAIITQEDAFNQTSAGTIAGWTDIVQDSTGYQSQDVDGNETPEYYLDIWTIGEQTRNALYERGKWLTRRGSSSTVHGINGQLYVGITHQWNYDNEADGPFTEDEELSWGTGATAGTGILLALKDDGSTGTMWIQLLTGVAPSEDLEITGGSSSATCDVNGSVTSRIPNKGCFLGNYTGNFAGAYGVGVDPDDLIAADSLTALDGTARNPPNNITIEATQTVSGDVMFCARTKTHSTTVSGAHSIGDTTLTLASGIPAGYDPNKGKIVVNDLEHTYTAFAGADVTIAAPGLQENLSGGETVTVTQFDTAAFTCDTDTGDHNGTGDTVIQFTGSIGSGYPGSGKVRVWNTSTTRFEVYSYTAISGARLTGISPALSRSIATETAFIPIVDEAASGTSISKIVVYPGSSFNVGWRLYNATANIQPFSVPAVVTDVGSSTPMTRISDA